MSGKNVSGKNLLIVESPAKAKTLSRYLSDDYTVMASYGHVRDLSTKEGAVDPDDDFAMKWDPNSRRSDVIKKIENAAKSSDTVLLATDPDREGEAISWHIYDLLAKKTKATFKRVRFQEITKSAILEALKSPDELDAYLVDAYFARRSLDYLVGYTLSPILWRKLPGSRSAGRVQSVALRLLCDREQEIEAFKAKEYWSIDGVFSVDGKHTFPAKLAFYKKEKLEKFSITNEAQAKAIADDLRSGTYQVDEITHKQRQRRPSPPYTTSALQQDAANRLRLAPTRTMRLAQQLYEGVTIDGQNRGLITYMRTDSIHLAGQAIAGLRDVIGKQFGTDYLPDKPNFYAKKAKNAQEAHEAIRPTDVRLHPDQVRKALDKALADLYTLIWQRTVASQMKPMILNQTTVSLAHRNEPGHQFHAHGQTIVFDGFGRVTERKPFARDEGEQPPTLPKLEKGQTTTAQDITPNQHFTQPPPRYSEARLIKTMEEYGIGRPSTYASVLQIQQDRDYAQLRNRVFYPTERGRLVGAFLTEYFKQYVEYDFTARVEDDLDNIATGSSPWRDVLRHFWDDFSVLADNVGNIRMTEVIDVLNKTIGERLLGGDVTCPSCKKGTLSLKLSRSGGFFGCSRYEESCTYTQGLLGDHNTGMTFPKELGTDPETKEPVSLRKGPYGIYVQRGIEKPKRSSLPPSHEPDDVTLQTALQLLSLPRLVGDDPTSGRPIKAGIGRYGPYLLYEGKYTSLRGEDDVLTIGLNRAVEVLAKSGRGQALGEHDDGAVTVQSGRFGPYVQCGKVRASLPKDMDISEVTLEIAIELIEKKKKAPPRKKPRAKKKA